jgi:hypothetical protein
MPHDRPTHAESPGDPDSLDPLASFLPETQRHTYSSASVIQTVSALDDFSPERSSATLESKTAGAQIPRLRRADAVQAHIDPVVSSARSVTRGRVMLLGLMCLAVFLPSLATLGHPRGPRLSTVRPSEPALNVAVVDIVRPVEIERNAQLSTQSSPVPAPRDTQDGYVTIAPAQLNQAPAITPSARTSPLRQTTASDALRAPPISRTDGVAQRTLSARSAGTVSSMVSVPVEKARPVTPALSFPIHYGSMSVTSQPAGAHVTVDGQLVGATPIAGWELPARSHVVRIDLEGYDRWSASIRVVAEQKASVVAILQPTRQTTAR